jgi:hypothetical protein
MFLKLQQFIPTKISKRIMYILLKMVEATQTEKTICVVKNVPTNLALKTLI